MTAWHLAANLENSKMLLKVWQCAKEKLATEEINILILGTDK